MYTTEARVRELSGFNDTTKINSSRVNGKITVAQSLVTSAIGYRYQLPVAYHVQNQVTFSGTGTGPGTLTVTINGVAYPITIALNTTAQQCADQLRAIVPVDFKIDWAYPQTVVVIFSKLDSGDLATANIQATITLSAGTVAGITAVVGGLADRYSRALEYITADVASSLLKYDEYGPESQNVDGTAGMTSMQLSAQLLKAIQGTSSKWPVLRLFDDYTDQEIGINDVIQSVGYPNASSNADIYQRTGPKVRINMKF